MKVYSRFKRVPAIGSIELTERDKEILRLVHRHRFLRSSNVVSLLGGSEQQISRRLKLLYHHGYLERPRSQLNYFHTGGSRRMVYGLGNKAATVLKLDVRAGEKNQSAGRIFMNHALLVSDIMVAIELACRRNSQVKLIYDEELKILAKWKVKVDGMRLSAIPDRIFALEYGNGKRVHFFLEADRGTMPAIRKNFSQTSFYRKLIAYAATWTQNLHRSHLGIDRFRVLTVTTNAKRIRSLADACGKLRNGHRLFLFTDKSILTSDVLSHRWRSGKVGEIATLLD
ncbi:MAG TPA: replication-relaxation family protein [Verrucomicrobiae bacterium]|nr:replication-relaxation family protein [Verrucomicrobiae bacterium]